MITTTLNRIRAHSPCGMDPRAVPLWGFCKLRAALGPDHDADAPIPFSTIARINGLDDALWCCRAEPQHARVWRLFAVWCARQVEHKLTDERSRAALDVAERHEDGLATDDELAAAWVSAMVAARAASTTARDAAWAASAAASTTARDAAWAARAAASATAWADESVAASAAQLSRFIEVCDADPGVELAKEDQPHV